MPDNRIKIDKDATDTLNRLLRSSRFGGPFETMADALAFAAAYGATSGPPLPISQASKDPSPIRLDVFFSRGYETLINVLAIKRDGSINILQASREAERATAFEEYANSGLKRLKEQVIASGQVSDRIALLLRQHRKKQVQDEKSPLDVSELLGLRSIT